MIKYFQKTPVASDCTAGFDVYLDKEYTVGEFIEAVLQQNPREWGVFALFKEAYTYDNRCVWYRDGSLHGSFPNDILERRVKKVDANGGWSMMDYRIWTEEHRG